MNDRRQLPLSGTSYVSTAAPSYVPRYLTYPREYNLLAPARLSNSPTFTFDDGPLRWTPQALPLPCAYLRLPWPPGRSFARLLPSRQSKTIRPAALTYRQYVKKMMVEEVCSSPAFYLLRYVHFASSMKGSEAVSIRPNSRLLPFVWARKSFLSVQAMSLQRWHATMPLEETALGKLHFVTQQFVHPYWDEDVYVVMSKLTDWEALPLSYRDLESSFLHSSIPDLLDKLSNNAESHRSSSFRRHLVVAFDAVGPHMGWSPHNMRQVVHLVGQTVSLLSSMIPLFLDHAVESVKTTRQSAGFASFQVVIYPPAVFHQGVNNIRSKTSPTKLLAHHRNSVNGSHEQASKAFPAGDEESQWMHDEDHMIDSDSDGGAWGELKSDLASERVLPPLSSRRKQVIEYGVPIKELRLPWSDNSYQSIPIHHFRDATDDEECRKRHHHKCVHKTPPNRGTRPLVAALCGLHGRAPASDEHSKETLKSLTSSLVDLLGLGKYTFTSRNRAITTEDSSTLAAMGPKRFESRYPIPTREIAAGHNQTKQQFVYSAEYSPDEED